ncbi:uncharacterized protein LOC135845306 [Planococcus citri]|uniref:uncharacterized protein LOC135845306 n=1 Tax=Planococcus citri TaxID=170843 RepID=UPI0031FA0787
MIYNVNFFVFVLVAVMASAVMVNTIYIEDPVVPVYINDNPVFNHPCVQQCVVTALYDPFCGTDLNDYGNKGWLTCFDSCYIPIEMLYDGTCEEYKESLITINV